MTFPVIESRAESNVTTAGTSHAVTKPAGVANGDLWIIFFGHAISCTLNALAGWTELVDTAIANGEKILVRQCDGTEGASVTFTSSASTKSAHLSFRISGALPLATQAPQLSTVATGTSTTPNATAVTPTGGAKDYLFITAFVTAGEEADDDTWAGAAPTNYANRVQKTTDVAGTATTNCSVAAADRTANTSSEDAAAWSANAQSLAWRAWTIAVHPSNHAVLVVQGAAEAQTAESPALVQHNVLVVQDGGQVQAAENIVLTAHEPAVTLVIQDAPQPQIVDNVTLTAHAVPLVIADAGQLQTADNPTLAQHHVLAVDSVVQLQTVGSLVLVQHNALAVEGAGQLQNVDTLTLTGHESGAAALEIQDASQAQVADTLTLIQHTQLTVQGVEQLQITDNLTLVQNHLLAIQDAIQLQLVDNLDLTALPPLVVVLVIASTLHLQWVSNISFAASNRDKSVDWGLGKGQEKDMIV